MVNKIYCYADESGQDTGGKSFFVAVVIINKEFQGKTSSDLIEIEKISKKGLQKWGRTPFQSREKYLLSVAKCIKNCGRIYYAIYHNTKEYIALTASTIAQAILSYSKDDTESSIIIDGLKKGEERKIMTVIKNFRIKYSNIKGLNDRSEPFLRLADAVAGLARDADEEKLQAKVLTKKMSGCLSRLHPA